MSQVADADRSSRAECPPLPPWAALIGLSSALGELALIADGGVRLDNPFLPVSMALTALVVVWVSYGVLAGRTVRLVLAAVVLVSSALGFAWDVVDGPRGYDWPLLHLALTLAALAALVALVRSPFHRWQRDHHDLSTAPVLGVLLLAAVTGVLGPVGVQPGPTVDVSVHL